MFQSSILAKKQNWEVSLERLSLLCYYLSTYLESPLQFKGKNSLLLIISYKKLMMNSTLSHKNSTHLERECLGVTVGSTTCYKQATLLIIYLFLTSKPLSQSPPSLLIWLKEITAPTSMSKCERTKQKVQFTTFWAQHLLKIRLFHKCSSLYILISNINHSS